MDGVTVPPTELMRATMCGGRSIFPLLPICQVCKNCILTGGCPVIYLLQKEFAIERGSEDPYRGGYETLTVTHWNTGYNWLGDGPGGIASLRPSSI